MSKRDNFMIEEDLQKVMLNPKSYLKREVDKTLSVVKESA